MNRTQEVPSAASQPFGWFRSVMTVSPDQQRRLDEGDVLIEPLPASGKQVGFFAAVAVRADPDVLLDRLRHLPEFREGPTTPITRRFSSPPRLDDLAELTLPERDIENLQACRPGDCRLKLTADEIAHLRKAVQQGDADWRPAAQSAFREIVLERLRTYQQRGLSGLAPYVSAKKPLNLGDRFEAILLQMTLLREQLPEVASYLERYPTVTQPDIDVAFYWTIEQLRKPVVTVRQFIILDGRGEAGRPEVLSVDKQLFALHYVDAQLSLTALVRGAGHNYLVHVNYSEVDLLDGFVAWLRRLLIERGVQKEARGLLFETRRRLERRAVELASEEQVPARNDPSVTLIELPVGSASEADVGLQTPPRTSLKGSCQRDSVGLHEPGPRWDGPSGPCFVDGGRRENLVLGSCPSGSTAVRQSPLRCGASR